MSRRTYAQMWQHIDHLKDVIRKMHDKAHERNEEIKQLKAENSKLLELVMDMYHVIATLEEANDEAVARGGVMLDAEHFAKRMLELGVEVDG